jgi:hypothetical protein
VQLTLFDSAHNFCRSWTKRGSRSPLHNRLRPIHFINRGGFTSAGISLQVWQDKFSGRPTGSRTVGAVVPSVALVPRAKFAAELLREIRSVSLRASGMKLEP